MVCAVLLALGPPSSAAAEVGLAWDANSEIDLAGYGVYFRRAGQGSYGLFGYVAVAELQDARAPDFMVTGLAPGSRYYFAVSAYAASGAESALSEPACADISASVTPCPASNPTGGGGGAGAACFIGAAIR
jgi:hypothetical protein